MNALEEEKQQIRKFIKACKAKLTIEEIRLCSQLILKNIESLPAFQKAETLMAYWALPDEVQNHDFILRWYQHKKIILPAVDGSHLRLKVFNGINNLAQGQCFGIEEPIGEDFAHPEKIELVIVPGIAFDISNNRLGRGKAYYDKFLRSLQTLKIGICFPFQLLPRMPVGPDDIKMDMVISC